MKKAQRLPTFQDEQVLHLAYVASPMIAAWQSGKIAMKSIAHGHHPGERLASSTLPGLKVIGYWNAERPQDWGLPWHRNEGVEFSFQSSGSNYFETANFSGDIVAGDLSITCPWQLHRVGNPHVQVGIRQWFMIDMGVDYPNKEWKWPSWIILTKEDKKTLSQLLMQNQRPVCRLSYRGVELWRRLYLALQKNEKESQISPLAILLNEILYLLIRELQSHLLDQPDDSSIAVRLIDEFFHEMKERPNLLAKPWTLSAMAARCGMSNSIFCRHCQQLTNSTPKSYLNKLRIEYAAQALTADPEYPITELAIDCGFDSSQYFATVFKKMMQKTPTEYRNKK